MAITRPILGAVPAGLVLLVLAAVFGVLAVVLRREGASSASSACWLVTALVVGAPLCLSLVTVGHAFAQHHVRWMWAFGAFMDVVLLWSLAELVVRRWPRFDRAASVVPLVLLIGLSVAAVPYFAQQQGPVADYASMPALAPRLPRPRTPARQRPRRLRHVATSGSSSRTAAPS